MFTGFLFKTCVSWVFFVFPGLQFKRCFVSLPRRAAGWWNRPEPTAPELGKPRRARSRTGFRGRPQVFNETLLKRLDFLWPPGDGFLLGMPQKRCVSRCHPSSLPPHCHRGCLRSQFCTGLCWEMTGKGLHRQEVGTKSCCKSKR